MKSPHRASAFSTAVKELVAMEFSRIKQHVEPQPKRTWSQSFEVIILKTNKSLKSLLTHIDILNAYKYMNSISKQILPSCFMLVETCTDMMEHNKCEIHNEEVLTNQSLKTLELTTELKEHAAIANEYMTLHGAISDLESELLQLVEAGSSLDVIKAGLQYVDTFLAEFAKRAKRYYLRDVNRLYRSYHNLSYQLDQWDQLLLTKNDHKYDHKHESGPKMSPLKNIYLKSIQMPKHNHSKIPHRFHPNTNDFHELLKREKEKGNPSNHHLQNQPEVPTIDLNYLLLNNRIRRPLSVDFEYRSPIKRFQNSGPTIPSSSDMESPSNVESENYNDDPNHIENPSPIMHEQPQSQQPLPKPFSSKLKPPTKIEDCKFRPQSILTDVSNRRYLPQRRANSKLKPPTDISVNLTNTSFTSSMGLSSPECSLIEDTPLSRKGGRFRSNQSLCELHVPRKRPFFR